MTRILIEKAGVVTDVPENELTHYLQLGYEKVGTAPEPEFPAVPTAEEQAVNDALLKVVEAQKELTKAEDENIAARSAVTVAPVKPAKAVKVEPIEEDKPAKKKVG